MKKPIVKNIIEEALGRREGHMLQFLFVISPFMTLDDSDAY